MASPVTHFVDVPYQHLSDTNSIIGVTSFSKHGISSIDMTVTDGVNSDLTYSLTSMSWNSQREDWVWCYNFDLNLTSLNDGAVTVTVTATDNNSNTRVVTQDYINDFGGTMGDYTDYVAWVSPTGNDGTGAVNASGSPYATIAAAQYALSVAKGTARNPGGTTVYLTSGAHRWGDYAYGYRTEGMDDWLRITAAPGEDRADVRITSTHSQGIGNGLWWFQNICIELNSANSFLDGLRTFNDAGHNEMFFDECECYNVDTPGSTQIVDTTVTKANAVDLVYAYKCDYHDIRRGFSSALVRNISYGRIGEDVCTDAQCLINVEFGEIDAGSNGTWHEDIYQAIGSRKNVLLYNMRGTSLGGQAIFQGDNLAWDALEDFAAINCCFYDSGSNSFVSQLERGGNHIIVWHCLIDQSFRVETTSYGALNDFDIRNTFVGSFQAEVGGDINVLLSSTNGDFEYISQGNNGGVGTNPINGSGIIYEDTANGDIRLASSDPGYEACALISAFDYPTGPRGPRNATTPDVGPFPDSATSSVTYGSSEEVVASAPVITGNPTIAGTAQEGEVLTATAASVAGNPTPTRTWQWYRSPSTSISGATNSTYTLQAADVGETIFVRQTETNTEGNDTADSTATSTVIEANSTPVITGVPTIAGTAQVGQTLSATAASVDGYPEPTTTWQWYISPSTVISGETDSTYTVLSGNIDDTIFVRQTETNSEGSDTADSVATNPVVGETWPLRNGT
jgi:hypothetical protein